MEMQTIVLFYERGDNTHNERVTNRKYFKYIIDHRLTVKDPRWVVTR